MEMIESWRGRGPRGGGFERWRSEKAGEVEWWKGSSCGEGRVYTYITNTMVCSMIVLYTVALKIGSYEYCSTRKGVGGTGTGEDWISRAGAGVDEGWGRSWRTCRVITID